MKLWDNGARINQAPGNSVTHPGIAVPRTSPLGALLGAGLMAGAILSHLTRLGIEVMDDGGYLFFLALVVFSCCVALVFLWRRGVIRSSWSKLDERVGGRGRSREAISKK